MKRVLISLCLVAASALGTIRLLAACGSYFQAETPDTTFYGTQCVDHFGKISDWRLFSPMDMKPKIFKSKLTRPVSAVILQPAIQVTTHLSGPTLIPQCGTK